MSDVVQSAFPGTDITPEWILRKLVNIIEVVSNPDDPVLFNAPVAIKGLELLGKKIALFEPPKEDQGRQLPIPYIEINLNTPPLATTEEDIVD